MYLEDTLLVLLFIYVAAFLLLGITKGRKYLKTHPPEEARRDYLFHSVEVTLTLAGLAVTALALFIGLGIERLEQFSSMILFFSISFVSLTLSSNFARFPRRFFTYMADILADMGVLAIGCGFLVFFERNINSPSITITYVIFVTVFILLSALDAFKYYRYWLSIECAQQQSSRRKE